MLTDKKKHITRHLHLTDAHNVVDANAFCRLACNMRTQKIVSIEFDWCADDRIAFVESYADAMREFPCCGNVGRVKGYAVSL